MELAAIPLNPKQILLVQEPKGKESVYHVYNDKIDKNGCQNDHK